jgi:ubiquinone/menaquinone biosynthesis C-methylase UbiE
MSSSDAKNAPPIRHLPTTAAYDLWASVYDTDGNFLQALDTLEMAILLPSLLSQIPFPTPWTLVDLGCGTGRNTVSLLAVPDAKVVGLDASPAMLALARKRLDPESGNLTLQVYDLLVTPPPELQAHAVISTLVLEHIPIPQYFRTCFTLLRAGGLLLVTNMHAEMGRISQAGFVDPSTGAKVRPTSYAHTVAEVVSGAGEAGFEVLGEVRERAVDEELSERLGARARKWVGVKVWFAVVFRKRG